MERLVDITTPFGDAVWFRQMTGTEALSVPFEFEVVLPATFLQVLPNPTPIAVVPTSQVYGVYPRAWSTMLASSA